MAPGWYASAPLMAKKKLIGLGVSFGTLVLLAGGLYAWELQLRSTDFKYMPHDVPIVVWNPEKDAELRDGSGLHESDPLQLWKPRVGAAIPWPPDSAEIVNDAGYRGPLRPEEKPNGVVRILTFGDSSSFGHSVPYERSYSAQLEALLAERGVEAEVLCMGVVGSTILQGLARYEHFSRAWEPDFVTIAYGAVNDHLQGPDRMGDAEKIAAGAQPGGRLTALWLQLRKDWLVLHKIAYWMDEGDEGVLTERRNYFSKKKKQHRERKGIGQPDWEGVRRVTPDEFRAAIGDWNDAVTADGAQLVLVAMPRKEQAEVVAPILSMYTDFTRERANEDGLPLVNSWQTFKDAIAAGATEEELFVDRYHPTARGHRLMAEEMAGVIANALAQSAPTGGQ